MPSFHCVDRDQGMHQVTFRPGESLLKALQRHRVQGILAECGGGGACATCHVHLDPSWRHLSHPSDQERDILSFVIAPSLDSRLACQVRLTEAHADGQIRIAPNQR